MKIFFLGQKGIPAQSAQDSDETRVEALARLLAAKGHEVVATCAKPYTKGAVRAFAGIRLLHPLSFNPEIPGGFLHVLLSLISLYRLQPDVVHVHGWKAAALTRFATLISPESTFIWTIASIPSSKPSRAKLVLRIAAPVFDAISTPSRTVQYLLLTQYNVRAAYVPDGYTEPVVANIPLKHFGLRKNQKYILATARSQQDRNWIQRSHKKAKLRNALVFLDDAVQHPSDRARASLIRQAQLVIYADSNTSTADILQAMAGGRTIIATLEPIKQEILGTSALFVKRFDTKGLADALQKTSKTPQNAHASKRAQAHFTWNRILEEYLTLYHYPVVRRVPIDSIRSRSWQAKLA